MANKKGAAKGNTYALRNGTGKGITIYLSVADIAFLQRKLRACGEDEAQWRKYARKYAKNGIYQEIKPYTDADIV